MCQNEGAGLYPHPHFSPFLTILPFLLTPAECRGYADVAQPKERRFGDAIAMKQVQATPSEPDAGSHPDNVRPFVMAHMEMKMVAENCTVGGNRLSVMVLRM